MKSNMKGHNAHHTHNHKNNGEEMLGNSLGSYKPLRTYFLRLFH